MKSANWYLQVGITFGYLKLLKKCSLWCLFPKNSYFRTFLILFENETIETILSKYSKMIISTLNNYIQSLKKNTLLHGIFATCYVRDCEVRMFCDTQFLRFVCLTVSWLKRFLSLASRKDKADERLELPQVHLANFRVEYVGLRSGRCRLGREDEGLFRKSSKVSDNMTKAPR